MTDWVEPEQNPFKDEKMNFSISPSQLCSWHVPSARNAGETRSGATCHMAMPQCCYLAKGAKRPSHTTNMLSIFRLKEIFCFFSAKWNLSFFFGSAKWILSPVAPHRKTHWQFNKLQSRYTFTYQCSMLFTASDLTIVPESVFYPVPPVHYDRLFPASRNSSHFHNLLKARVLKGSTNQIFTSWMNYQPIKKSNHGNYVELPEQFE